MEEDVASFIIHFGDVSREILQQFTAVSLSKFIYCPKIWLGLTGAQNEVAVKSLEYFYRITRRKVFWRWNNSATWLPIPCRVLSKIYGQNQN